jgi:hypothetical protein
MTFPPTASRLALAVFLSFAASAAFAESKTLATVDGQSITEQDVDDAMADIGSGLPEKMDSAARRKYVLDYLIDLRLVARKALADKLDADPEFARKLAYYRDKIAMETVLGKIAKTACPTRPPPRPRLRASKGARISPKSPPSFPRTREGRAAISAGSPRTVWCRNSPKPRSNSSPVRSPIR